MSTPPRTILFLSPSSRMLGARQSLLQLARGLDPARYRAHVVVPEAGGLTEHLDAAGIPWTSLRLRPWRKWRSWFFVPATLRRLRALVGETGAALLHNNEVYPTPYAVRAETTGVPVVTHARLERPPGFARKYSLGRVDAVLCVSEAVAAGFRAPGEGVDPARIEVIYNGLDLDAFRAAAAQKLVGNEHCDRARALIEAFAARDGASPFVVGQFGLLSERKRHGDVLRALESARCAPDDTAGRRVVYLVLGDPGPRAEQDRFEHPREEARRRGLLVESPEEVAHHNGPAAIFLPFQEQVAPFYNLIDATILPSEREGFGRVLVEAAALGKPGLGADVGGIGEVIDAGATGTLFPLGDARAIAQAIAQLARDGERCARLGAAARERAERLFSLPSHVDAVMAVYDRLLTRA